MNTTKIIYVQPNYHVYENNVVYSIVIQIFIYFKLKIVYYILGA